MIIIQFVCRFSGVETGLCALPLSTRLQTVLDFCDEKGYDAEILKII